MGTYTDLKTINDSLNNIKTSVTNKGVTPSGNITTYATAISNLPTPMPVINREVVNGVYGMPTTSFTWSLPSGATDLASNALANAFRDCTSLTSVDLSSLTTVSASYALSSAFRGTSLTSVDLSGLTTVSGSYALYYAFNGCTGLTSVDLSGLTTVSGSYALYNAFNGCTGLTSVDLSGLTTVNGSNALYNAFNGCTGLTSVDLSGLTTVSGSFALQYAFRDCTSLTSVDLNSLQTIGVNDSSTDYGQFSYCFQNCNSLTSLSFPNLEKIYCTGLGSGNYGTFAYNDKVQKMYFPKLDTITYGSGASSSDQNACKNVFYGCSSLTELHFAAANQSAIEASSGYSTAWGRGASNVTIYFDL